jgi:hypothetical protein
MIWATLAGFDREYCEAKARDASTTNANRTTRDKGVGCDKSGRMGTMSGARGYGGNNDLVTQGRDAGRQRALDAEKQADKFSQCLYGFLAVLCPSPDHDKPETARFDVDPPQAVVSMLVNSKVLARAAELLRNDSLDDASKRKDLCMAFFGFVRNVGVHEGSKQAVLFGERVVWPVSRLAGGKHLARIDGHGSLQYKQLGDREVPRTMISNARDVLRRG